MVSDFLVIDGSNMPEPGVFSVKSNDLDSESSTRLENGNMQRDRIWSGARQIACQWNAITHGEYQLLLSAVTPLEFTATYYDPQLGRTSKRFYTAQWQADFVPGTSNYANGPLWNVSFDIIESSR